MSALKKYQLIKPLKYSTVALAIISLYFVFFQYEKEISLLPTKSFEVVAFSDDYVGGNSKVISVEADSSSIYFKYKIGTTNLRYAGFNLVLKDSIKHLVKKYNQIQLQLAVENIKTVSFTAKTWENDISKLDDDRSLRPNHIVLNCTSTNKTNSFKVGLKDLSTKDWWVTEFMADKALSTKPDWRNIKQMAILRGTEIDASKPASITLKELRLSKEYSGLIWLAGGILASIWLIHFTLFFKRRNKTNIEITYKPLEVKKVDSEVNLEERILDYIAHEYANSELKLENLSQVLGANGRDISSIIHQKFQMPFKQYLNCIRINESKKLLKNSELSIKEIAYQVGYSSPNHFRRVFKKSEGLSPSEFRN